MIINTNLNPGIREIWKLLKNICETLCSLIVVHKIVIISENTGCFLIEKCSREEKCFFVYNLTHCLVVLNKSHKYYIVDSFGKYNSDMKNSISEFVSHFKVDRSSIIHLNFYKFQNLNEHLCWLKCILLIVLLIFKEFGLIKAVRIMQNWYVPNGKFRATC